MRIAEAKIMSETYPDRTNLSDNKTALICGHVEDILHTSGSSIVLLLHFSEEILDATCQYHRQYYVIAAWIAHDSDCMGQAFTTPANLKWS